MSTSPESASVAYRVVVMPTPPNGLGQKLYPYESPEEWQQRGAPIRNTEPDVYATRFPLYATPVGRRVPYWEVTIFDASRQPLASLNLPYTPETPDDPGLPFRELVQTVEPIAEQLLGYAALTLAVEFN